ncbi:hypothetical protein [Flavobacterium sp.]|uniref:hypothetical protein n=1 Tax=Flavobacterium sp. TaxID=239 RepID=UPI00391C41EE
MKKQALLIFTILYFSINGYSQVCGEGLLTLNIYTKNGEKAKKASYEIFAVSKELIEKFNDSDNWNIGRIINNFSEQEISQNEDLDNRLNKFLKNSKISKSGKFVDCLKFRTFELVYFPVIVKISIEAKTVYILANYFGGCNREANLIYNGHYFKLI